MLSIYCVLGRNFDIIPFTTLENHFTNAETETQEMVRHLPKGKHLVSAWGRLIPESVSIYGTW